MSTQRRRVLEDSKLIIPADGVYIEGLDGRAYTSKDWRGGTAANSIIVASGDVKFRVALTQPSSKISLSNHPNTKFETYMTWISDETAAKADYNGLGNTANIIKVQPSTDYAAGYCNSFIFPDGKTKGYLPSLGQLYLVNYRYKAMVTMALRKCGGTEMSSNFSYWSSTFWGMNGSERYCWMCSLSGGAVMYDILNRLYYVRPFADIS